MVQFISNYCPCFTGADPFAQSELLDIRKQEMADRIRQEFPLRIEGRKSRTERPEEYPERAAVPEALADWERPYHDYSPSYYVSPIVLKNDFTVKEDGWAEPESHVFAAQKTYKSHEGPLSFSEKGLPLNPKGRTGVEGRGLLGKWGPNFAADPMVTRFNRQTGRFEILLIRRNDCGEWGIPGGMVDVEKSENVSRTLSRELKEETDVDLDFDRAHVLYRGIVDDRRNTDNAWMETTVSHLHLPPEVADHLRMQAGDDAGAVQWVPITSELFHSLYASHADFVRLGVLSLLENESIDEKQLHALEKVCR